MKKQLFLALLLALAAIGLWRCQQQHQVTYAIAYVGFHTTDLEKSKKRDYSDQLHIAALQHYIDQINAKKYGVRYVLKTFECEFEEDRIPKIYETIAADPTIALVVDNTWGKHIIKARDIIVKNNLPVLAVSADRNQSDFGSTVFLDPNDPQPLFLLHFIHDIMGQQSVGFITESDYLLHNQFEKLRCEPKCYLNFTTLADMSQGVNKAGKISREDSLALTRKLEATVSNLTDSVILLNAHSALGNVALRYFQYHKDVPPKVLIGLPGVTNLDRRILDSITNNGHTIITLESGSDMLPLGLYETEQTLRAKGDSTIFQSKTHKNQLRRCYDAMNIFESALQGRNFSRATLADYLKGLRYQKLLCGDELYEFNSDLILLREPNFTELYQGRQRTCSQQINIYGKPIPNLQVGVDILDIGEIDIKKNAFSCNMLYWVIADSAQIKYESYIDFDNITANQAKKERIAERREENGRYIVRIYRVSGVFSSEFEAFDFPFDKHEIKVPISALSSSSELRINFDYSRLLGSGKDKFKFSDWNTNRYFVTLDNKITNRLGSLDKVDTTRRSYYLEKYKSLNVRLEISRRPWGALILIIFPFVMFSLLPLFMLFFHRITFDDIGELIITSFLAAVAYSINLVQLSPTTDSLNRAYLFLLLALIINFVCFTYVAYKDRHSRKSDEVPDDDGNPKRKRFLGRVTAPYWLLILFMMMCYLIFNL
jgi:hypothetical protein